MKYAIAAVAVVAAIAGGALAQTSDPVAPAPRPAAQAAPSSCPAYPALSQLPAADTLKRGKRADLKRVDAQTLKLNGELTAYMAVHDCRIAEYRALEATYRARGEEARAGQDAAVAHQQNWKATIQSLGLEVTEQPTK